MRKLRNNTLYIIHQIPSASLAGRACFRGWISGARRWNAQGNPIAPNPVRWITTIVLSWRFGDEVPDGQSY